MRVRKLLDLDDDIFGLFDFACLTGSTVVAWLAACLTRMDGLAAYLPFELTFQKRVASASEVL